MSIECLVLPNTGHHYFFIPLSRQLIDTHGGLRGPLAKICREGRAWQPLPKDETSGENLGWIRYRLGYKGAANNIGVWLAIETNLGTVKRGTFHDEHEITVDLYPQDETQLTVSPYAYRSVREIPDSKAKQDSIKVPLNIELKPGERVKLDDIEVIWQVPSADSPIDVDLVVDFGNTRTVVLALENHTNMATDGNLCAVCRNIRFLPRGQEYPKVNDRGEVASVSKFESVGETICDSWFLLQEPMFADWDIPSFGSEKTPFTTSKEYLKDESVTTQKGGFLSAGKVITKTKYICKERVPQMFVEISPALMGQEAKDQMHNIDMKQGLNVSMSSPKRYLWDRDPYGVGQGGQQSWNINPNAWSSIPRKRNSLPALRGQICRYLYLDGRDWDIDHPPFENPTITERPGCRQVNPTYPRSTAMVWSALTIIESAYRQITSYNWREGNSPFINRRLRSVNVTFPSGWIAQERAYYYQAWKQAVDIFTLAHMDSRKPLELDSTQGRPSLCVELDEAVASQLPFIYSEIRRLSANLWIALYGRNPNPADYRSGRVRVMTVDIGGGTLDSSIIEYKNTAPGAQVALRYNVLFRDCSCYAGDSVTKAIIERVLLPSLLEARGVSPDDKEADIFCNVMSRTRTRLSERSTWQRIVTLLFLPVVRQWLTDVGTLPNGFFTSEEGVDFRTIEDCGADECAINDLNKFLADSGIGMENFVQAEDRLRYDPEDINRCIEDELKLGIEPLGKFVAAYDVDIVTLSGKISEMPKVEELLKAYLPIRPQRIVRMKGYLAGDWYPMASNMRINDAKTVTAVGCALYAAGKSKLLGAIWNIAEDQAASDADTKKRSTDVKKRCRNYWGVMCSDSRQDGFDHILLAPKEETNERDTYVTDDGTTYHGYPIMINSYIGRQKYRAENSTPERQYKLRWKGDSRKAPNAPLTVIVRRKQPPTCGESYEMEEDDIELVSVECTDPSDTNFDSSLVELQLRTLSEAGFWMEECRFQCELPNV
ncbi:MAG TPA: virulence factor SrfB [Candidatus Akkermansia intestinigallinarum]|uniref:Virulence factor SrfB n=1 Tax=Candidatus Akkermansia intestinigallinarum TaxID=2838431 RepID=A0A9D2AH63_9BACT|nr:virulence factor SrfB [Candidatus Akkermansia intestinigallinarum]